VIVVNLCALAKLNGGQHNLSFFLYECWMAFLFFYFVERASALYAEKNTLYFFAEVQKANATALWERSRTFARSGFFRFKNSDVQNDGNNESSHRCRTRVGY